MADYTIRDPQSGKTVTVRGTSPPSESELNLIFKSINAPVPQSDAGGLAIAGASGAIPIATRMAEEVATNPGARKALAAVGNIAGAASQFPNPAGMVGGAWLGGKVGWRAASLAQKAAAPVATILEKAAPYMSALTKLGGVQSALDLAQMADPKRQDIGFLGIGSGTPDPDHPALLNLALSKAREAIQSLISHHDMTPEQAAQALLNSRKKAK